MIHALLLMSEKASDWQVAQCFGEDHVADELLDGKCDRTRFILRIWRCEELADLVLLRIATLTSVCALELT